MWTTLLIILAVILVIGIIRICVNKPSSFGEAFMEVLCVDLLGDVLGAIFEHIDFD